MRTFLLALCILLAMLTAILLINARITRQLEDITSAVSDLPDPSERECAGAVASLEAKWNGIRPLIGLAVNGRTVAEIDRLMVSLRAVAARESELREGQSWEHYRSLLLVQLSELQKLMRCGGWEII